MNKSIAEAMIVKKEMLVDLVTQQDQRKRQTFGTSDNNSSNPTYSKYLSVIDAFSVPRYRYHQEHAKFIKYDYYKDYTCNN